MEETCASIRNQLAAQAVSAANKARKDVEEAKMDAEGLRQLLEIRTRDLKKIRVSHFRQYSSVNTLFRDWLASF